MQLCTTQSRSRISITQTVMLPQIRIRCVIEERIETSDWMHQPGQAQTIASRSNTDAGRLRRIAWSAGAAAAESIISPRASESGWSYSRLVSLLMFEPSFLKICPNQTSQHLVLCGGRILWQDSSMLRLSILPPSPVLRSLSKGVKDDSLKCARLRYFRR